ncbi:hypothetical protein ACQJBY_009769 [Aegilops geniculata]
MLFQASTDKDLATKIRNYWILYIKLDQVCPLLLQTLVIFLLFLNLAIELHWFLQRDKWQKIASPQVDLRCSVIAFVDNMVDTFCSYRSSCWLGDRRIGLCHQIL